MRTTLSINDATLKRLKGQAAREGRSFKEVVNEALQLGLAQKEKPHQAKPFRLKPHPLGMKPGFRKVSLNQLYDQIEAETATETERP